MTVPEPVSPASDARAAPGTAPIATAEPPQAPVGTSRSSAPDANAWPAASAAETHEIERFLYDEAALLDAWDLERWLELITDDITYVVPATDVREGDANATLTFINDDITRLRARVARLTSRRAFREYPWSRTRRLVSNIRVDAEPGGTRYTVSANFTIHWFRHRRTAVYVGRYEQVLHRTAGGLRIARRVAVLDMEALDPHGAVSIIL